GLIAKLCCQRQSLLSRLHVDADWACLITRRQPVADDCSHASGAQVAAVPMNHYRAGGRSHFQLDWQLQVDAPKHTKVSKVFAPGPDHQVIRPGEIPVVSDVAYGANNLE